MASERILILEDNESLLAEVAALLQDAGYVTERASSYEEAVDRAREQPFDILLADVYLPDRSGLEAFQEIRALRPDLAGIVMTGYSTMEVAMEALRAGFAGFLVKPFTTEQLISAIVAAVEQEKLRRENARLQALVPLYDLARAFMSASDLPELLNQIVVTAQAETRAEAVSVMLTDEGGQELSIAAAQGVPPDMVDSQRLAFGDGIAGWVAEHGEPLMIAEGLPLDPELQRVMGQPEVLSALSLPLVARKAVIGVLNLSRLKGAEPFTRGDLELASVLASQAAIAIDKARLIDELRLLNEASQRLAAALDLAEAAEVITEATANLLGARRVALWLMEEVSNRPTLFKTYNFAEAELKLLTPPSAAFLSPAERFQVRGPAGVLTIPIVRGTVHLGLIEVELAGTRRPREDRLALLRTLAQTAGTVIEAHRLRAREVIAFRELDSALRSDLNLRSIIERVLQEMIHACNAEGGSVYLVSGTRETLQNWFQVGLAAPRALAEAVIESRKQTLLRPDRFSDAVELGVQSAIGAPMMLAGHVEGAVVLTHHEDGAFGVRHLNLLSVLASTAALVFRNAQLYSRSEEAAITEERTRIAREIHDGLAQDLSFLLLRVETLRKLLALGRNAELEKELGELTGLLRNDVREVRRTIFALRPLDLESLGFVPALEKFVGEFGTANDVKTHLTVEGETTHLVPKLETALFRLTQESLNNVRKHAQASNIWIELAVRNSSSVNLSVRDDGRGFDLDKALESARARGSVGLIQMRERAERAGGRLQVRTAPGQGTEICIELPVR